MADNRLIDTTGRPRFGYFDEAPVEVNAADFNYRTPMGGRQIPGRKWLDYNQFQYIGVISDELLVGCALGDFRYLGIAFVYTYLPATGDLQEFSMKLPLSRGISLTNRPLDGISEVKSGGNQLRMTSQPDPRILSLDVDLKSGLEVKASFNIDRKPALTPMVLCTQTGRNGWVLTEKIAGVPATGWVDGPFGRRDLAQIGAYAHSDYTVGYMRRETFWNWACLSGAADGHAIGVNVSCGVNETSYSENCIWIDGALTMVGLATFDYDRQRPDTSPWQVKTMDGVVDLMFEPEGTHTEKLNAVLVASDFTQVFGKFSGVLRPADGPEIAIDSMYGFVEDQYAKW